MIRYFAHRATEAGLLLLVMSFVIYLLLGLMPGDPIDIMASGDPDISSADIIRLKALYGLDRPILERYAHWAAAAASGDFGYSRLHTRPVLEVLGPRLWNTTVLMGLSFIFALVIAIPLGIVAAVRVRSWADYAINLAAFAGFSLPSFWLALLLILLFSVTLGWLPAGGVQSIGRDDWWDWFLHLIMPVTALTLLTTGRIIRFTRAAMIEALRQDYVRTAEAKGLSPYGVVVGHAMQNAMIPVVTVLALDFGTLFSGALVIEQIFSYQGMGKLIYDSILGSDFNVALVGLLFATILTLLSNLGADLVYGWLDPRISYEQQ